MGGAAVNMCIYKAFYDDQCIWKQAAKETTEVDADGDSPVATTAKSDAECGGEFSGGLQFEPIDNRHMSNVSVIKARLERLLQQMPNGLHIYRNIVFALVSLPMLSYPGIAFDDSTQGFTPTSKNERRIFTRGLQELVRTGHIEKVLVPSARIPSGRVLCVRLKDAGSSSNSSTPTVDVAEDDAGDDLTMDDDAMSDTHVDDGGDAVERLSEGNRLSVLLLRGLIHYLYRSSRKFQGNLCYSECCVSDYVHNRPIWHRRNDIFCKPVSILRYSLLTLNNLVL